MTAAVFAQQPQVRASADALTEFYVGDRSLILVAAVISGVNILNLMWFAAALRTSLAEAGRDGWGAAVTASSAAFGGLYFLFLTVISATAFAIAGTADTGLVSGLNDLAWALTVSISFPRAMLVMSGAFGLWRAGLISNALFAGGVAAVVLNVLGGTTWLNSGVWAPGGVFSQFVAPAVSLIWILVVTSVLTRTAPTRTGW